MSPDAVPGHNALYARLFLRKHGHREIAARAEPAGNELNGVHRGETSPRHGPIPQTLFHFRAHVAMGDGVEILQRLCIRKDDAPQGPAVQHPVYDAAGKTRVQFLKQFPILCQQLMIDRVAVQDQTAQAFDLPQGRGLAGPAAAGDAEDRHMLHQRRGDLLRREGPLTQDAIGLRGHQEQGRFFSQAAGAAVHDGGNLSVEIALDLLGRLGARLPGGIGRWRGKGDLRFFQKLQRQGMIRAAQAHGLAPGAHDLRHALFGFQYDGQWAGPEALGQSIGLLGYFLAIARHGPRVRHHQGEGLALGPALHLIDVMDRLLVQAVAGQAVDRLGGHSHQFAPAQQLRRRVQFVLYDLCVHGFSACFLSFCA